VLHPIHNQNLDDNQQLKNCAIIFDLLAIVPFIKKFGKNPETNEPLDQSQLIKLTFHKN